MVNMKDFSGYSDGELLDELDCLSLEISCELGTKRGNTLEKIYWLVMKELERRGVNPITGEEYCVEGDILDDDYEDVDESYRKDEDDFQDCFNGREEGDDGLNLPF